MSSIILEYYLVIRMQPDRAICVGGKLPHEFVPWQHLIGHALAQLAFIVWHVVAVLIQSVLTLYPSYLSNADDSYTHHFYIDIKRSP